MADSILKQLQTASKGLLYPSEQDRPIKAFFWPQAEVGQENLDTATVRKMTKQPEDAQAETKPLEFFFSPVADDPEFQGLQQALKQLLTKIEVYRFGDTDKQVYVVGKTSEGDFAGVSTHVVET